MNFIMQLQSLGPSPKMGSKTCKISVDFIQLQTLVANIWNESIYPKSERHVIESDSSHVLRKKSGELWSTNYKVRREFAATQMELFSGDYISDHGGAAPQIFIHAID